MYYLKKQLKKGIQLSIAALSVVLITSCSSYDNVSSYDDGIYSSKVSKNKPQQKQNNTAAANNQKNVQQDKSNNSNSQVEESYFDKQAKLISQAREQNNDVFTDVDNYTSQDSTAQKKQVVYDEPRDQNYQSNSYGGWGTQTSNVNVNVYNTGFNNWGLYGGFNRPFYRGFGFYGRGFGYNNWIGGFGFYDPFFGPYYGYGFGPYYGGFYGNARYWSPYIYGRNHIAYNNGYEVD